MRREIKIPINSNLENYFDNWVNFKIKTSKHHNDRLINSIYFDSEDFITAQDNLAGISGRKKYRIRWYNNDDKNINYEIKLKKNNLGQKYSLNSNVKIENLNDLFSIKNEFLKKKENDFFLNKLGLKDLKPKLKIAYLRSYYLYKRKIRITFDKKISYELLNQRSSSKDKFDDHMNVIELKFELKDSDLALELIKESNFVPKRFSKYLRGLHLFGIANYI